MTCLKIIEQGEIDIALGLGYPRYQERIPLKLDELLSRHICPLRHSNDILRHVRSEVGRVV